MRLIDADKLLTQVRQIDFLKTHNSTKLCTSEIMMMINRQPTAFNVEKVVEGLERQAEQERNRAFEYEQKGYSEMADKHYGKYCSYEYATEIVRKGGAPNEN